MAHVLIALVLALGMVGCSRGFMANQTPTQIPEAAPAATASTPMSAQASGRSGVADTPTHTQLCSGVFVDTTGSTPADVAINQCIKSAAAGTTLLLPAGIYLIQNPIAFTRGNITFATKGLLGTSGTCMPGSSSCATLKAASTFANANGLLYIQGADGLTLDHIIVDGNRSERLGSAAASDCTTGGRTLGRNIMGYSGNHVTVQYSASINTLCATAMAWGLSSSMDHTVIHSNYIGQNGMDYLHQDMMWSDGLTIGTVSNATIDGNTFEDNTDVDLILGGATGASHITNNTIQHTTLASFAGFMLTNWTSGAAGQWADFRGLVASGNTIRCFDLCDLAVQLGVYPWLWDSVYSGNYRTMGGAFSNNTIYANKQGIDVAGAGTPDYPVTIYNNTIVTDYGNERANTPLKAGMFTTTSFNISEPWSESFVNTNGTSPYVSAFTNHGIF